MGRGQRPAVDPFYRATVQAWRASGIFPSFSNGNSGPGCDTAGSPGDYVESYGVGRVRHQRRDRLVLQPRAAGEGGIIRPNMSAPGVNVRSSVPGNGYAAFSGTSMAAPHTVGTVALMWSAAPSLIGDIPATAALLDSTAVDVSDLTCGGTAGDNNVWGEGKLNAFAAVDQSPRGPTGTLTGMVTNASNGSPLAGATVQVGGPEQPDITTGADGTVHSTLPVGAYTVTASLFGYGQVGGEATVTEGQTTTLDFALTPVPTGTRQRCRP